MATNTATSFTNHTGNASAGPFSISFSYLDEDEVDVRVSGVLKTKTTHYTFPSATTISFTSGNHPANGVAIKFQRNTDISAKKVDFQDGSVLTEADLDNNSDQILYGLQEHLDTTLNDLVYRDGSKTFTGNLVFEGATDDAHETTLAITDPTADRTITLPNTTGTVVTTGDTGTITSTMINDGTIATADLADNSVTMAKLNSGTLPSDVVVNEDNLAANSVGSSELADDAVDTAAIADNAVTMAKLNSGALPTDITVTSANIVDGTIVTGDIATGTLDNRYYTETELDAGQLDNRYYTETEADARFYNLASTEEIQSGETWVAADNKVATTSAIDNRIVDLVDDVGGFVPLVSEATFPAANPDVNNGAGTIVSVGVLSTSYTPSGGTVTIPDGTLTNISGSNVTITDCGSTVLASGHGVLVETTTTLHTYKFHRLTPKATEVTTVAGSITNINTVAGNNTNINTVAGINANITTVAGISSNVTSVAGNSSNINSAVSNASNINSAVSNATNINTVAGAITNVNNVGGSITNVNTVAGNLSGVNDFSQRYRAATNNSGEYSSNNDVGDLYFNTDINAIKVWNGSAWVAGVTDTGDYAVTTGDTFTGNLKLNDSVELRIGTGDDLKIYHDGSNSFITNSTGDLKVYADNFIVNNAANDENKFRALNNGAVELYYDGSLQCKTASYGLDFADNKRADFGDGNDLLIYHDGSNNFIDSAASQSLIMRCAQFQIQGAGGGETLAIFNDDGDVELYYDGTKKFETQSGGISVTGGINLSTNLSMVDNGLLKLGTGDDLQIYHDGGATSRIDSIGSGRDLEIRSDRNLTLGTQTDSEKYIFATKNGAVELYYDGVKCFQTNSSGAEITGAEGGDANLFLYADEGDDNADKWLIQAESDGFFALKNHTSGSWEMSIKATGNVNVELYYDNSKKFETASYGTYTSGTAKSDYFSVNDSGKFKAGASDDLQIFHDSNNSYINHTGTGDLYIQTNTSGDKLQLWSNDDIYLKPQAGEDGIKIIGNGAVELYYDNEKVFNTEGDGVKVWNQDGDAVVQIVASEANAARILMAADDGDDNNDKWNLISHEDGYFAIQSFSGGAWTTHVYLVPDGKSAISYHNSIKLETTSSGVTVTGSVNETSDIALKENIQPLSNSLANLKQLNGYSYKFKDTEKVTGAKSLGLTAQEVEKVYPDLVEGEEGEKTLQYSGLIAPLLEAVKELSTKIETLETKVAALESA